MAFNPKIHPTVAAHVKQIGVAAGAGRAHQAGDIYVDDADLDTAAGTDVQAVIESIDATITDLDGRVGVAVADADALTSADATGGESPTEAEHNALRADVVEVRAQLNALLDSLRDAGVIAAS